MSSTCFSLARASTIFACTLCCPRSIRSPFLGHCGGWRYVTCSFGGYSAKDARDGEQIRAKAKGGRTTVKSTGQDVRTKVRPDAVILYSWFYEDKNYEIFSVVLGIQAAAGESMIQRLIQQSVIRKDDGKCQRQRCQVLDWILAC